MFRFLSPWETEVKGNRKDYVYVSVSVKKMPFWQFLIVFRRTFSNWAANFDAVNFYNPKITFFRNCNSNWNCKKSSRKQGRNEGSSSKSCLLGCRLVYRCRYHAPSSFHSPTDWKTLLENSFIKFICQVFSTLMPYNSLVSVSLAFLSLSLYLFLSSSLFSTLFVCVCVCVCFLHQSWGYVVDYR